VKISCAKTCSATVTIGASGLMGREDRGPTPARLMRIYGNVPGLTTGVSCRRERLFAISIQPLMRMPVG
jgi:hypothetical protein